jgi:uncharacterized protein YycO
MIPEAGDIGLTLAPGFFSKAIQDINEVLPEFHGDKVPFSHAFLVSAPDMCIEAIEHVSRTPMSVRLAESEHCLVLRMKGLTGEQRVTAVMRAERMVGLPYSYKRLAEAFFDDLLDTRRFMEMNKSPDEVICSELVSMCYQDIRIFNGVDAHACTPEDLYLDFLAHPDDYEVVFQK